MHQECMKRVWCDKPFVIKIAMYTFNFIKERVRYMAVSIEKMAVAGRFKQLREQSGYTQEQFAEKLDISLSTVKKIEAGEYNVSLKIQRKLKETFDNISIDQLLFGEVKKIDEIWTQILFLDNWHKYILLQKLLADLGFENKKIVTQRVDEEKLVRFVEYLKESFKE